MNVDAGLTFDGVGEKVFSRENRGGEAEGRLEGFDGLGRMC